MSPRWSSRSVPPSSTDRTCRWTPTPGSRPRSPTRLLSACAGTGGRLAAGAGHRLRRQRRARRLRRHRLDRHAVLAALLVEFGRSACQLGAPAWCSSTATAATSMRCAAAVALLAVRRARRRLVFVQRPGRRRPCRPHRNVCIATYFARRRADRQSCPGNSAPLAELMPEMRAGGVAAVSRLGVLGDPTTATAEEGARFFAEMVDGCARRVIRWAPDREGMLT